MFVTPAHQVRRSSAFRGMEYLTLDIARTDSSNREQLASPLGHRVKPRYAMRFSGHGTDRR
jgi:hypothetical protein